MYKPKKRLQTDQLASIPGIGKKGAQYLREAGIHSLADLKDKNPDDLYQRLCYRKKQPLDRCLLYQFRCAVYYASEKKPYAQLLYWWKWKD